MPLAVAGGILACATSVPAMAEAPAEGAAASAASAGLEEVVVTARRREERLQDVPVAAQAFTTQQIKQYDISNLANIKVVAPQVSFDRAFTGSGTSIAMRGISSSSLDAGLEQSVLIDIDGMPISRGRILQDAMFDMASIQVLKGPQSLFFGKNTPGGVVSVRSADPTENQEGYARLGYEFTSRAPILEAAFSGPINDAIGYRVAAFATQSEGYIRNASRGVVDPFRTAKLPTNTGGLFDPSAGKWLGAEDKYGFRGTLTYDDGGAFDANLKLLVTQSRNQGLQSFTEVMSCAPGKTHPAVLGTTDYLGDCKLNNRSSAGYLPPDVVASWPSLRGWGDEPAGSNDSFLPTLTMNYKWDDITLTSVTGYYDYDYKTAGQADGTAYSFYFSYQKEKFHDLTQEIRVASDFDGPLNFVAGGYYETAKRDQGVGGMLGVIAADPRNGQFNFHDNLWKNELDAYSLFAQLSYKPIEQLEIAGGARYTSEDKTLAAVNKYVNKNYVGLRPEGLWLKGDYSDSNTSPEATITWHFNPDLMVYGAYKTGYLSGGFSNLGTFTASITLPAITFKPVEAEGYEIGTKFAFFDRTLQGSLTGYDFKYDGLQLTTFNGGLNPPTFTTTNAASTKSKGVELELSYAPPVEGLSFHAGVYYNDASYEEFKNAQCYAGQTAAQGCLPIPGSAAKGQDLSGAPVWRAPEWIYSAGVVYDFALTESLKLGLNADMRHSSGYFVSTTENPGSWQDAYTALNAGIRLGQMDDSWTIGLIGRNLTDEIYATLGADKSGGSGEVMAVAAEPRMVVLQLETRF